MQHVYMSIGVIKARKLYKVPYPALYADEKNENATKFNCVQRGMQNSLENLPTFYALLLTAGLRYPVSASIAAAVYLVGRIFYFKGYSTGDPKGRQKGGFTHFGALALVVMVFKFAIEVAMG